MKGIGFKILLIALLLGIFANEVVSNMILETKINKLDDYNFKIVNQSIYHDNSIHANTSILPIYFPVREGRTCSNKALVSYPENTLSMHPLIGKNDTIWVDKVKSEEIELGDVIVYEDNEGNRIIHAVVGENKNEGCFVTQGYRNLEVDSCVPYNKVLYRYCTPAPIVGG